MSPFFKNQVSFILCLLTCFNIARAQELRFSLNNGDIHMCPLSLRSFDGGYLPPHTNLLNSNYELHDIRPLTWICDPADSVLNSVQNPVLLVTDEWPCSYDARTVEGGTLVLMTVDSSNISSASIPSFDNNSEQFGPAYVIATSNQCVANLYSEIENIESVEFKPNGQPVYWNRTNNPSYFVSESINLKLPCLSEDPFTLAITVLPQKNLEIVIEKESTADFNFSFLTLGHGLADRRSKRYAPILTGNHLSYNVSSGEIGDLVQINPRCSGVDSFQISIKIEPVDLTDSCLIQTHYPFSVAQLLDTTTSIQTRGQYAITIPLSTTPISFISDDDELNELPNRDPQGRHKSYYVYDDFIFDLVIGSQAACDQLNLDLNDGFPSSTNSPTNQASKNEKCYIVSHQKGYSCNTHVKSEVVMLSDYYTLGLVLPKVLDVAHCKGGYQSQIVPAIR